MSFLVVNSVTVDVADVTRSVDVVGDNARAFDGTYRATERARKKNYQIRTVPMTRANADTLEAAFTLGTALSCSGDLTGSGSFFVEINSWTPVKVPGGHRVVCEFTLHEA